MPCKIELENKSKETKMHASEAIYLVKKFKRYSSHPVLNKYEECH